jgi:hypothetical protein
MAHRMYLPNGHARAIVAPMMIAGIKNPNTVFFLC